MTNKKVEILDRLISAVYPFVRGHPRYSAVRDSTPCVSIRPKFDYPHDPLYAARGINDGTELVANRVIHCNNTVSPTQQVS